MKYYLLLSTLLLTSNLWASEFVGAKTAGLGGAGSAAVESIDSLYLNPAAIASANRLYFGSGYTFGSLVPGVGRETFSVTMSDGSPGVAIPGSFSYKYHRVGIGDTTFKEQEFKAGVGFQMHPKVSMGLAYSYLKARSDTAGEHRQNNFDLGLLFKARENWNLSLVTEGLVKSKENLPEALRRQSRWGLGTQIDLMRILQVRYDLKSTLHQEANAGKLAHALGLSFILRGYFHLNLGATIDDVLGQSWRSVGIVWSGPKLKLGYSIQNEGKMGLGTRHLVDLWLDL